MKLRNIKDVITVPAIVKIKKVFEAEIDKYGSNKKNSIIEMNNEELYATFKEKDFDKAVIGNQLMANPKIYKKDGKDFPYIEWFTAPGSQNFTPKDLPFKQEQKNDQPNLAGNGASFNLAFEYCLLDHKASETLADMLLRVLDIAEKIKPVQERFVSEKGNAVVKDYTDKIDPNNLPF